LAYDGRREVKSEKERTQKKKFTKSEVNFEPKKQRRNFHSSREREIR